MAPELFNNTNKKKNKKKKMFYKGDIWSLGLSITQLCVLDLDLESLGESEESKQSIINSWLENIEKGRGKPLAKILRGMLSWEPEKRPSISDVLQQLEKEFGGILETKTVVDSQNPSSLQGNGNQKQQSKMELESFSGNMNSGPGGSNYQCQIPSERIGTEDINKWNLNSVNSFGTKNSFGQQHQMNDFSAMDHGSKWNDMVKEFKNRVKDYFAVESKSINQLEIKYTEKEFTPDYSEQNGAEIIKILFELGSRVNSLKELSLNFERYPMTIDKFQAFVISLEEGGCFTSLEDFTFGLS